MADRNHGRERRGKGGRERRGFKGEGKGEGNGRIKSME